jgi:hypothetical protein
MKQGSTTILAKLNNVIEFIKNSLPHYKILFVTLTYAYEDKTLFSYLFKRGKGFSYLDIKEYDL